MAALLQVKKQYFMLLNGAQHGPISSDEIRKLRTEGSIQGDTMIWAEGMADWLAIQMLPEFSAPPPPPLKRVPPPIPKSLAARAASLTQKHTRSGNLASSQQSEIMGNIALAIPILSGLAIIFYPSSLDAILQIATILGTAFLISLEASSFGAGGTADLNKGGKARDGVRAWSLGVIFLWGICFPLWFYRRAAVYGAEKRLGTALLAVTIFFTGSALSGTPALRESLFESKDILTVKHGHFLACPNRTIEQGVKGFFGSPKWESGTGQSGIKFVNVIGQMTYMEKPVQGMLQFTIEGNTLSPRALELNGVPQMELIKLAVIGKICGNI